LGAEGFNTRRQPLELTRQGSRPNAGKQPREATEDTGLGEDSLMGRLTHCPVGAVMASAGSDSDGASFTCNQECITSARRVSQH
jgi:hypothetical protein